MSLGILAALYAIAVLWQLWSDRLPHDDCRYETITIHIKQQPITIATTSLLTFIPEDTQTSQGAKKMLPYYGFRLGKDKQEFCEDFEQGKKPIHAKSLSLNFWAWSATKARDELACRKTSLYWPQDLCAMASVPGIIDGNYHVNQNYVFEKLFYPETLMLYEATRGFEVHIKDVTVRDFDDFAASRRQTLLPVADRTGWFYQPQAKRYWFESAINDSAGRAIILACNELGPKKSCITDYMIGPKIRLQYTTDLTLQGGSEQFRIVHDKVHAMLRQFSPQFFDNRQAR